jgi:hypothetical protein
MREVTEADELRRMLGEPDHRIVPRDRVALATAIADDGEPVVVLVIDRSYLILPTEALPEFAAALDRCMVDRANLATVPNADS